MTLTVALLYLYSTTWEAVEFILRLCFALFRRKERLQITQLFSILQHNIVAVKIFYTAVKSALRALLIKFIVDFFS